MQVNITGHHVEVTPALRDYVNQKLEKIHRRFSNITSIHVTLTVDSKFLQKAEAQINLAKAELFAKSESENMYAAIDLLIDKLDRQVVKHKEKLNGHGHGNGDSLI
jgi:putative sigma-54 modulation protein